MIKNINPKEACLLWNEQKNNSDFLVIDVRTPEEYAEGHIKGAINIDYFDDKISGKLEKLNKNKKYLLYCRSGRRSGAVGEMMQEMGFKQLTNLLGGLEDCQNEDFEIVK